VAEQRAEPGPGDRGDHVVDALIAVGGVGAPSTSAISDFEPTTTRGRSSSSACNGRARLRGCAAARPARHHRWRESSRIKSTRARSMWRRNWCRGRGPQPPLRPGRDVGHHELDLVAVTRRPAPPRPPEMRDERGEGVVGHLRLGGRDREMRWTCLHWAVHECDVGGQLELHVEPALLALLPLFGKGWSPALVGQKARIAWPPLPLRGKPPVARPERSQSTVPSRSFTTVPTGTATVRSVPRLPCFFFDVHGRRRSPPVGCRESPAGRPG